MYLLYLDGSGLTTNALDDYVVLAGVAIHEAQISQLSSKLDALAAEIDPGAPEEIEFHGSPMLSGRKIWRRMPKSDRVALICRALEALRTTHWTTVLFGAAIHKATFSPDDAFEHAFEQIVNRFDRLLRRKFMAGHKQKGLLVVDDDAYERKFQRLAIDFRTRGHRWGVLRDIVEVPLFVDSHASRLVQFADLVSYSLFRYYQYQDDTFFNVIKTRFDSEGGIVHGLEHGAPPEVRPVCPCPSCVRKRNVGPTPPTEE